LDELLQQRAGEPFGGLDPSIEEVAAVAACLVEASEAALGLPASNEVRGRRSASGRNQSDAPSLERSWKALARKESLRG
jgi:hypothetical protein